MTTTGPGTRTGETGAGRKGEMTTDELFDLAVDAHDRWLASKDEEKAEAWDRFTAARDAWFAMGGGKAS